MPGSTLFAIELTSTHQLPDSNEGPSFFQATLEWRTEKTAPQGDFLAQSEACNPDGTPAAELRLNDGRPLLNLPGLGSLLLTQDGMEITCSSPQRMMPFLLGRGLGLFLEWHGVPVLHGSSVCFPMGALALCGAKGMGKSSLAFTLNRHGIPSLSDDLVPLYGPDFRVLAGPAHWKLWPDIGSRSHAFASAPRVLPDFDKRVLPGSFSADCPPLSALLLLEGRRNEATEMQLIRLPPAQALTRLIGESYQIELIQALPCGKLRLPLLARLVEKIPVYRFIFPKGPQLLDALATFLFEAPELAPLMASPAPAHNR